MITVARDEHVQLCTEALLRAGADLPSTHVLADATIEAELVGNRAAGLAHLFDYLAGYREGHIVIDARPVVRRPAPAVIDVDARQSRPHSACRSLR
jgi:(2R)-3-sulfolactate dehydrogenase (NADP+)